MSRFPHASGSGSFELLDEVWAPTDARCGGARADLADPGGHPSVSQWRCRRSSPARAAELGLPEGFLFLFSFDYLSVFERKNPLAVVEAFTRAFAPDEGPSLVLKCINAERDPASHERLLAAAA